MTLPELVPLFAQTGALGVFAWILYRFFRVAVDAHIKRADDWEKAAARAEARADERDRQLAHILSAVKPNPSSNTTDSAVS